MEYDTPSSLQIIVERKTFTHLQELAGTIKKNLQNQCTQYQKKSLCIVKRTYVPPRGKTNNVVSEQVRHKPTRTVTEKI